MSATGVVDAITQDWQGDTLDAAASAGTTLLSVFDAGDFSEDADTLTRYLLVGGEATPRQYVDVDKDADTVTLAATVGGSGLEAGLPVVLWDPTVGGVGAQAVEYVATVTLDDGSGSPDAVIPHDLIPTTGVDGLIGATVSIDQEDDDDDWYVAHVLGREPTLRADFIVPGSEGKWVSDGEPPATASTLELHGGIGAIAARWSEVPNQDPVTYRLHMAAGADPATDGTMEVAAGVGVTAALVRNLADGTPVVADGTVTYHLVVSVEDADGRGPDSAVQTQVPAQVTGPDIAADVVTANFLIANDAFVGALQAVDVSGVTITGTTIQTDAEDEKGIKLDFDENGAARFRAWGPGGGAPFLDVNTEQGLVVVAGAGTFETLTVTEAAEFNGAVSVSPGTTVSLEAGTTPPTSAPVAGAGYDTTVYPTPPFGTWADRHSWTPHPTSGFVTFNHHTGKAEIWDLVGGALTVVTQSPTLKDGTFGTYRYTDGGRVAPGGGKIFGIYEDSNAKGRVIRFDTSLNIEAVAIVNNDLWDVAAGSPATVGYDSVSGGATPVLVGQARASDSKVQVKRFSFTGSTVTLGASVNTGIVYADALAAVMFDTGTSALVPFDFTSGTGDRYVFVGQLATRGYHVYNSTTAAEMTSESWNSGSSSDKVGAFWDGTSFKMLDTSGAQRTYTDLSKLAAANFEVWWVPQTYFRDNAGTDYQTPMSPRAKVIVNKRSRVSITGAALPASPGANDPTGLQFYVATGASDPGSSPASYAQFVTQPATGVRDIVYTTFATNPSVHPPSTNNFPSSTPGVFESAALAADSDPMTYFKGDGTGRALNVTKAGIVNTGTLVAATDKDVAVVFNDAFPTTDYSLSWLVAASVNPSIYHCSVVVRLTTGFTFKFRRETGTAAVNVDWTATYHTQ